MWANTQSPGKRRKSICISMYRIHEYKPKGHFKIKGRLSTTEIVYVLTKKLNIRYSSKFTQWAKNAFITVVFTFIYLLWNQVHFVVKTCQKMYFIFPVLIWVAGEWLRFLNLKIPFKNIFSNLTFTREPKLFHCCPSSVESWSDNSYWAGHLRFRGITQK